MPLISGQWLQSAERMRGFKPVAASVSVGGFDAVWKENHYDSAAIITITRQSDEADHFLHLTEHETAELIAGLAARVSDQALLRALRDALNARDPGAKG